MGCPIQIGFSVLEPWKSLHRTIVLVLSPGDKIDVTVIPKIPLAVIRCKLKPMKVNETIYWGGEQEHSSTLLERGPES